MATSAKSAPAAPSKTNLTWAAALSIVAIPTLALGLTDPLEGFAALVVGIVLLVVVRVLSRVRIPKLALIPFIISFAMIAGMMLILLLASDSASAIAQDASAQNVSAFIVVLMLWPQRIATIVMVAGLIVYTVRLFRVRAGKPIPTRETAAARKASKKATSKKAAK